MPLVQTTHDHYTHASNRIKTLKPTEHERRIPDSLTIDTILGPVIVLRIVYTFDNTLLKGPIEYWYDPETIKKMLEPNNPFI